ncbi:MAG: N-acetylmuramoyl-L-alanine amidase [Oscillospiraceae bacterium]|nr:N-acetylmuramoyl-L-alanine amidase [Oscillospiraceae bacterium]
MPDKNYYYDRRSEIAELKKQRRRKSRIAKTVTVLIVLVLAAVFALILFGDRLPSRKVAALSDVEIPLWIDQQIMPSRGTSRRAVRLEDINAIVVHYVGNPGTTAQNNRDYYDNEGVTVNSHFIVGLDGEIIQCIPLDEKSSASNDRNRDTISIEVCHPDETGKFSEETYNALVKLAAWLCEICEFDEDNIIRHYDVTGKICPLYYVENEDAWVQFKKDVMELVKE